MIMNTNIHVGGVILVFFGIIFFINNFVKIDIEWSYVWPLVMIIFGISLILNKK